jgi:hypothetical protein
VGASKRYADHFDREADKHAAERAMRTGKPASLSPVELQLSKEPLTRTPAPRPVKAWVRYGDDAFFIDGYAVAWTDFAVAVRWDTADGEHHAWLWASAVRPR